MPSLVVQAPAKLNLFLHITGRRADLYHLLESLVVFTEFGDTLELTEDASLSLSMEGEFASALQDEKNNLVMKAARMLHDFAGIRFGARMVLRKNIPVAAGMGGGSSDAAAALKGLCRLWDIAPDPKVLSQMAQRLGSDVPACLAGHSCIVRGIGEIVSPVETAAPWLLLLNPRVPLATEEVFRQFTGEYRKAQSSLPSVRSVPDLVSWIAPLHNDLQIPAKWVCPQIREMLDALSAADGCRLARMSGSGATCFGLFEDQASLLAAEKIIAADRPEWWRCVTRVRP